MNKPTAERLCYQKKMLTFKNKNINTFRNTIKNIGEYCKILEIIQLKRKGKRKREKKGCQCNLN